jgi:WD40 repeat protein
MPAHPDKLKQAKDISRPDIVFSVARVAGGSRVFVGTSEFRVCEADLAESKPEFKNLYSHGSYVTGVALAGKHVVSGGYDGKLIWWDVEKKTQARTVDAHAKWVRRVEASPDGKLVVSVADDMVARIWDAESGNLVRELRGHKEQTPHHYPSMLYACNFSPDGKHLATGDKVGHIVIWEVATGKEAKTLEAPVLYTWDPVQRRHSIGGIRAVTFSPDGNTLAVGGIGKIGNIDHLEGKARIEAFDWQKGERVLELESDKFKGIVNQLRFGPQGDWLMGAGGAGEGFLLFVDLKAKKLIRQEKVAMHVHDVAADATFETLVTAGHRRLVTFEMKG